MKVVETTWSERVGLIEWSHDNHVAAVWLPRTTGGGAAEFDGQVSLVVSMATNAPNVVFATGSFSLVDSVSPLLFIPFCSNLVITSSSRGVSSGLGAESPSPSEHRTHFFLRLKEGRREGGREGGRKKC